MFDNVLKKCLIYIIYVDILNSYYNMFAFIKFFMTIWFQMLIFALGFERYITHVTILIHLIRSIILKKIFGTLLVIDVLDNNINCLLLVYFFE